MRAVDLLQHALRQAPVAQPLAVPRTPVLVAGGGGALGSAVVEGLLGCRGFDPVRVLVTQPFAATARGLQAVVGECPPPGQAAPLALAVFDRPRRSHGRDEAFFAPAPAALAALAAQWHAAGVRDLVIVMPHDSGSMPAALMAGLASLSEQAVAAIGFTRVVILRPARAPRAHTSRGLQRVADALLAQLRMMVPQTLQPVRPRHVARLAVEVARQLGSHPAGTRVLASEQVWQAAQAADPGRWVRSWLGGEGLPDVHARPGRL
jgi:hypothetical protein